MRYSASFYVDNQEEIGFPLAWLVPRLPKEVEKIYVFASDDSNLTSALRDIDDPRVVSEPIGVFIRKPSDISTAQNECVRRVDRKSYDAHLLIQSDIWMLPVAFEGIAALPYSAGDAPCVLSVEHVRLHASTHRTWYGVTIFFPDGPPEKEEFEGDGAYPRSFHVLGVDSAMAMDVGWHSVDAIARHLRVHARTWSSSAHASLVRLYETDRVAFIRGAFEWIRKSMGSKLSPMSLDGPYGHVVESMGLHEEYQEACSAMFLPPLPAPSTVSRPIQKRLQPTGYTRASSTQNPMLPKKTSMNAKMEKGFTRARKQRKVKTTSTTARPLVRLKRVGKTWVSK